MRIILQKSTKGWQAMFQGGNMPQDIYLPLPFTPTADKEMVKADLRSRFPNALFTVKGDQKGCEA